MIGNKFVYRVEMGSADREKLAFRVQKLVGLQWTLLIGVFGRLAGMASQSGWEFKERKMAKGWPLLHEPGLSIYSCERSQPREMGISRKQTGRSGNEIEFEPMEESTIREGSP